MVRSAKLLFPLLLLASCCFQSQLTQGSDGGGGPTDAGVDAGPGCPAGDLLCNGRCQHTRDCGRADGGVQDGGVQDGGVVCPFGETLCEGQCISNERACCAPGESLCEGQCIPAGQSCPPPPLDAGPSCPPGESLCNGQCAADGQPCAVPIDGGCTAICANDTILTSCANGGGCMPCRVGEACNANGTACVAIKASCQIDTDCPCGCICQGGSCECMGGIPPSCQSNADCGPSCSGLTCQDGSCTQTIVCAGGGGAG